MIAFFGAGLRLDSKLGLGIGEFVDQILQVVMDR